jgi:hypothetical protein
MGAPTEHTIVTLPYKVVTEDSPDDVARTTSQTSVATACAPRTGPNAAGTARTYAADHT